MVRVDKYEYFVIFGLINLKYIKGSILLYQLNTLSHKKSLKIIILIIYYIYLLPHILWKERSEVASTFYLQQITKNK